MLVAETFVTWISNTANLWDSIGWFLAGLGTVGAFVWRHHRKQIKNVVREELISELDSDLIKNLAKAVEEIHHETKNNGGSSMKDAIDRVERNQNEGFKKVDEQMERMERYIQKLEKVMERHLGYHDGHDD